MVNKLPLVIVLAVMMAVVGGLATSSLGTTVVDAKCQPNRPNDLAHYQTGWYRSNGTTMYAAEAAIEEYSPWVAVPPHYSWENTESTAWTMLENGVHGVGARWAQVGWMEKPNDDRRTFISWTTASGGWLTIDNGQPQPLGYLTAYKVEYAPSSQEFKFYRGGVLWWSKPAGFVPTKATIAGEILTKATQMPGGYAPGSDVWLFSSRYQDQPNGVWNALDGQMYSSVNAEFTYLRYGSEDLSIWDRRCAY
jgi:hypothetical protein